MKNKILVHFIFFLIYFVDYTNQIFFILDPFEQRCISKEVEVGYPFTGVFFISGEHEESNKAFIKNQQNQVVWDLVGQKTGNFNYEVKTKGSSCFIIILL